MSKNILQKIEEHRAAIIALEKERAKEYHRELADLNRRYNLANEAIGAFKGKGKRHRAVISRKTHDEVRELVLQGKTGNEIAKIVGVSIPSVHNIKKALGLIHAHRKAKKGKA